MAEDIKTLLEQLNEILNRQVTADIPDSERIRLGEEDTRLTGEIKKLIESQNLTLDQLKEDFGDIENLGTIIRNLRNQDQTNPAVPMDTRGIFKRFSDMFKKSDPSVVGNAAAYTADKNENFKTEVNTLTNSIKSLKDNIETEDDDEAKSKMGEELEKNIDNLIKLISTNKNLTNNIIERTGQSLESFFEKSQDNLDYLQDILQEHEEQLKEEREKRQEEYEKSVDYFKTSVRGVFDTTINNIKGHFNDIFGDLNDLFIKPLMDMGKSLFKFGKATSGLFGTQKDDDASITAKTLLWIKEFYKDQRQSEERNVETDEKKFPWLQYLGIAMVTLGGIVGGLIRRFTYFFEIFQIQKLGIVQRVIEFFAKIGSTVGGWIDDAILAVSKIPKVGKFVSEVMEQFMKFFPAMAKGFKFLGPVFSIFLGAIDFIKGFVNEKGNIVDKIRSGLQSAVEGFLDLPVGLLGKIGDMVLGWFGTEIEGGMGNLMKTVITDYVMTIPNMFADFFNSFIESEESGFFGKLKDGLLAAMGTLIKGPSKLIGLVGDEILGWFGTEIEGGVGPKIKEIMLGMFESVIDGIYTISGSIIDGILLIPKMVSSFIEGVFQSEDLGIFSLKDGIISAFNTFKDGMIDIIGNLFDWVDSLFDWGNLKDTIVNKIKGIPGAGLFFKSENEKTETPDTVSGRRSKIPESIGPGPGPGMVIEKGGPLPSMSTPSGMSGSMSVLNSIRNILADKLNKIIEILSGTSNASSNIIAGIRNIASGVGNTMTSLFNRKDKENGVKNPEDVVGVGTELSEVPRSAGNIWIDPMDRKRITSEFGLREHPVTGKTKGHKGLDMAGPEPGMFGYPIKASKDGMVSIAKSLRGYGNVVYMDHENGYQTRYAHLNNFKVKPGDMIAAGDVIGGMGNTGVGTGPHLHYEVRKDGKALNPMNVLSAKDGAMIKGDNENEFSAKVHPDEAILPLNDSVLTKLGEKIGQYIDIPPAQSNQNINGYIRDLIEVIKTSTSVQENNYTKFLNSLKEILNDKEGKQMIVNNMNNRGGVKEDIPDKIENSMMMLLNSNWGV